MWPRTVLSATRCRGELHRTFRYSLQANATIWINKNNSNLTARLPLFADGVVRFEGTEKLLKEATTPADVARGKELKEMNGLKHDLLSNAAPQMLEAYTDWAGARLEAFSARA